MGLTGMTEEDQTLRSLRDLAEGQQSRVPAGEVCGHILPADATFPLCPSLTRATYVSQSTLSSVPAWSLHWERQIARASMLQADTEAWGGFLKLPRGPTLSWAGPELDSPQPKPPDEYAFQGRLGP